MAERQIIQIDSVDDPRIAAYARLKERDLSREGGRFIAESEMVVRRLLASGYQAESVLLSDRRLEELSSLVPAGVTIYVADTQIVNGIVGFKFHSGVMAIGLRGLPRSLADIAAAWDERPLTLMICPEIANTENIGAMIRIAAAFGVDAMILGERCCDPFYRQSIRVSMGTIFAMPIIQSPDLLADMRELRTRYAVELLATVLDPTAEPLASARPSSRMAILFGNEAQGLGAPEIAECDRRITIPMLGGTDSLNVSVAAGVVLYHFTQGGGRRQ